MTEISSFNDRLDQLMQGICPECGSQLKEECTDFDTEEWLLTCPDCGYEILFSGYK